MNETNNIITTFFAAMGMVITEFYSHLSGWLLFGLALVLVDLRFGILAARKRGEEIRPSRATRRTINKSIDYLSWVTLAELASRTFGVTIGVPVVSLGMLFIIYAIELNSCMNNYFEYKGIRKRFDVWRLIRRKSLDEAVDDLADDHPDKASRRKPDRPTAYD